MFTGIVEEVAVVQAVADVGDGRDIVIRAGEVLGDLEPGDSVNVDGVCQTVVEAWRDTFKVHAIATTLGRTTLDELRMGRKVNLERALAAGERFGGHFVQGHVDGMGTVSEVRRVGEMVLVRFQLPETVRPFTVPHGSIAVDGVSLTINDLSDDGNAEVALIPHTVEHTNLSRLAPGIRVNLEGDLIGKYVARAMAGQRDGALRESLIDGLSNWG